MRKQYIVGVALLLVTLSLVVRFSVYPVITDDYTYFLQPWFATLASHPGFSAFQTLFSDYAPLYLYLLKFLTLLPFPSLDSIKTLSLFFDGFLAFVAALIIEKNKMLVFAVFFAIPTVLMNSSLWGQCDSLYASFVLLSVYYLLRDRPLAATLAFAISFCFKIQSIFFLPVLIGYLWRRRLGDLGYLVLIPLTYAVSIIPAYLGGGSFNQLFFIYVHQSGEYQSLTLAAPTIFTFVNNLPLTSAVQNTVAFGGTLVAAAAAVLIIFLIKYGMPTLTSRRVIFVGLLSVLLLPFFLPHMHERYFYLADIFSVLYACFYPKRWFVAGGVVLVSFLSYLPYLSKAVPWFGLVTFDFRWLSALLLVMLVGLILPLFRRRYLSTGAY